MHNRVGHPGLIVSIRVTTAAVGSLASLEAMNVMRRIWVVMLATLAVIAALPAAPQVSAEELVVSDTDPSVQVSGPWQSASTPGSDGGLEYLFRNPSSGGSTVFWPFPDNLSPGQYEVFARWVSGPDRATRAVYWVASDEGTLAVPENQQTNGGAWQRLGGFQFQPGASNGVTLTDSPTGVVVADAVRWLGPVSTAATATATPTPSAPPARTPPGQPAPTPPPSAADAAATWTVTLQATELHAGPDASTAKLADVPQFSYLEVLGYQGDWAYVYNPRARGTAYAPSSALGPSDPPPGWVTAPPPVPVASVEEIGRTVGKAPLAYYPVDDKFAYTSSLELAQNATCESLKDRLGNRPHQHAGQPVARDKETLDRNRGSAGSRTAFRQPGRSHGSSGGDRCFQRAARAAPTRRRRRKRGLDQ